MDQNVLATIKQTVTENPIVLYMKGTPLAPRCGFSGRTVQILQACGVNNFVAVDVYADKGRLRKPPVLRQLADVPSALR